MTKSKTKNHDLPNTDASLPIALLRAREAIMAPIRLMLSECDLTEQQWRILRVLDEEGPMDARAVAQAAALSAPSLSRILGGLEARDLISRRGDMQDRRKQIVEIKALGRDLIDRNKAQAQAISDSNRKRLGDEKYQTLLNLLGEVSAWKDNSR